jgi:hypothetical protein
MAKAALTLRLNDLLRPSRTPDALRARWVVPIDQPLILISQIQRSGGTLLTHLFDDHPECFVHPYELMWGSPTKFDWPQVDLARSAAAAFDALHEAWIPKALGRGFYRKGRESIADEHPFVFSRALHRRLMGRLWDAHPPVTHRQALDCYLTAFFNAWLDCQGIYRQPKRFVVGFTPRVAMDAASLAAFWRDYPDGYLISVIREPVSWFASATRHRSRYRDVDDAIAQWTRSVESTLEAAEQRPDRVVAIAFHDLVENTERTIRRICAITSLPFAASLLQPTFNGRPVLSNSSFASGRGIDTSVLDRSCLIAPAEAARVRALAGATYESACARLARHGT